MFLHTCLHMHAHTHILPLRTYVLTYWGQYQHLAQRYTNNCMIHMFTILVLMGVTILSITIHLKNWIWCRILLRGHYSARNFSSKACFDTVSRCWRSSCRLIYTNHTDKIYIHVTCAINTYKHTHTIMLSLLLTACCHQKCSHSDYW